MKNWRTLSCMIQSSAYSTHNILRNSRIIALAMEQAACLWPPENICGYPVIVFRIWSPNTLTLCHTTFTRVVRLSIIKKCSAQLYPICVERLHIVYRRNGALLTKHHLNPFYAHTLYLQRIIKITRRALNLCTPQDVPHIWTRYVGILVITLDL